MSPNQPSRNPSTLHGQLPFVSHPRLFFCIVIYGMCRDLLYRCMDTLLLKNALDLTPCRLQQNVGLCAVLYCKRSEQVSQKKIKHSHVDYGHVHNALSRHYKDGQMVANVQESTSANINLDVIECTEQSADTPA